MKIFGTPIGMVVVLFLLLLTGCIGEAKNEKSASTIDASAATQENIELEKRTYTYNDFLGEYLHYDSADRSYSDMMVSIGDKYIIIGWHLSEFECYEILERSIDANVLTLEYYLHLFSEEEEGVYDTMTITLTEEDKESFIILGTDLPFYQATPEQVENCGYMLPEANN